MQLRAIVGAVEYRRASERQVKPLSTEDQRHLEAAQGWLILGDLIEADAELENISPLFRAHPRSV